MLAATVKSQMIEAMKAKDTVKKEVLRVVLGELDVIESRTGTKPDDEQVGQVLKKLVKSNEETLTHARTDEERAVLQRELEVLASLLPKALDAEAIVLALGPVREAIAAATADGPAVGIAMKHLKASGANVDGKAVSDAIRRIRGAN